MRRTFSFGALALLLSGSTLVPAISERALAATRESSQQEQGSTTEVAIREAESAPVPAEPQLRPLPQPIAPVPAPAPRAVPIGTGQASWYGPGFYGNRTANGEVFRPGTMTAAHRTLPFGTRVRVTNLNNGRVAVVRINDRGPFHGNRVIDLGHGAARELGVLSSGLASVKLEVLR
jgi:rare lipoprotein A